MPTAHGCRERRQRLYRALSHHGDLVLTDPLSLRYGANFYPCPFSLNADYGAVLVIRPDGHGTLYYDQRVAKETIQAVHADECKPLGWYDGQSPGRGARRWILHEPIRAHGGRVHDSLADTNAEAFWATFTQLRRAKDPDELEMIRLCCRVAEFGFEWAYANVKPGMTELDVYLGVSNACARAAGEAVVVYGDFAVSPGPSRKGGPPTAQRLNPGETFILDYSVVLQGYRSDFTTTLAVGGAVRAEVKTMFELCQKAMAAGESQLKPGTPCQTVYDAVAQVFADAGMKDAFPHHAGHGLGISHPEAPFFVSKSEEALVIGDVVTLEPGLYVEGTGGIRIEHNYAITPDGYERLSQHDIRLT